MGVRILAVGEAIMDVVVGDGRDSAHPGGSPTNIAYGLARLGDDVSLLTSLADDDHGRAIVAHLEGAGVDVLSASLHATRTATATATIGADGSASYDFDVAWTIPDDAVVPAVGLVHTGSIGAFLEPGASAVEELLAAERPRAIITLDPNIRPALVGSHPDAVARFARLVAVADVVKLSDEDAGWLFPGSSLPDVAARLLEWGAACVAITRGADGALLASAAGSVSVPGIAVDVVDTIGAGDSFMSALIHSLVEFSGGDVAVVRSGALFDLGALEALGGFAVRCAAVTCTRAGARPPALGEVG
jgi:fructokinase